MSGSARLEHTVLLLGRLNIFPRWKPLAHTILKEATADDGVSGGGRKHFPTPCSVHSCVDSYTDSV